MTGRIRRKETLPVPYDLFLDAFGRPAFGHGSDLARFPARRRTDAPTERQRGPGRTGADAPAGGGICCFMMPSLSE